MSARALLDRLTAAGLTVTVRDGALLRFEPGDKFTADLRAAVVALKPELLALLAAPLPDDKRAPAAKVEIPAAEKVTPQPPKLSIQTPKKEIAAAPKLTAEPKKVTAPNGHERKLQRQRQRRAARPRIDYYPSDAAIEVLDTLRRQSAGNASSIIDRMLVAVKMATPEAHASTPKALTPGEAALTH